MGIRLTLEDDLTIKKKRAMEAKPTFNILMYSHDTYGLGHIRRTLAIAGHLSRPGTNILILTGSPLAGRFELPRFVDFVRIPGMIKKGNDDYSPLSIKIDSRHAMEIRKSIILATTVTFKPDLFIVDKEPLGLKQEVQPTLEWIRSHLKKCRTVLGLRDVMDDARTVQDDWKAKGVYSAIQKLYSEVWVYGDKALYDPVREYAMPPAIAGKVRFTGYISRKRPTASRVVEMRRKLGVANQHLVSVTTGGGGDGFHVLDSFLTMLEEMKEENIPSSFKSLMVTGPFLSQEDHEAIEKRAKGLGVTVWRFVTDMEVLISASDLVICMGGYNTICEILSQKTLALVIPRESPRQEQLIRARAMKGSDLLDYIAWSQVDPAGLKVKINEMLACQEPFQKAMDHFRMTGTETISKRISIFRSKKK